MAIGDDFSINYITKRIYHSSGSTIYTVNQLYSWLQNTFDDADQMDDNVPMSAQTPTAYTLINNWFIDEASMEYLKGGAISTNGWANKIHVVVLTSAGYADFSDTDLDKTVTDDTADVGPLLGYDNVERKIWVRDTRGTYTAITNGSDIDVTGGTQNNTSESDGTGESLYTNVYTLGSLASPVPHIYFIQGGTKVTPQYWADGHVDILFKVQEKSTLLASGYVTVYARQWTDLYDHFEIDLSPGGRQAVPLATSDDLNNTTASGTVAGYSDISLGFAGPYSKDIGDGAGAQNYDYSVDCNLRPLDEVYEYLKYITREGSTFDVDGHDGERYTKVVDSAYLEVKQAPFGTFAGGTFFGARGIWIENMAGTDAENYQLIDSAGTVRQPPTQAPITVTSVEWKDRVLVCESTGNGSTTIKKNQYTISGTIPISSNYIDVTIPIPQDTPTSGFIRVVDVGASEERYTYSGYADHTFGLNTTTSKEYAGPTDTAYVPYIDTIVASGSTSVQVSLTYAEDRFLVGRVRQYGIIPFQTTGKNVTGGTSLTAIRTEDTIVE
jgi:hypothetical protein